MQQKRQFQSKETVKSLAQKYAFFSSLPVMLHAINAKGELQMVSDMWLQVLGYSREEVIGKRSVEFLTPESQAYAKEVLPAFFRDGFCVDVQYQFVCKDGSVVDVLLSANSSFDDQDNFEHSLAFLTNVTELKNTKRKLQEQKVWMDRIVESMPDAMVIVDEERRIQRVNKAMTQMFGYDESYVHGKTTKVLYADEKDYRNQGDVRYNKEGDEIDAGSAPYLVKYKRQGGEEFLAETVGGVIYDETKDKDEPHVLGYIGIIRDVTQRERSYQKIVSQERRINAVVEAIPDSVFEHDMYGRLEHFAHKAMFLSARPGETASHLSELLEPEIFEVFLFHAQRASAEGSMEVFKFSLTRREGRVSYEWRINPTHQGHLVSAVRDMTLLEQVKRDLESRHLQLEHRNHLLDQFAYIASHDLRSPLRAISQVSSWFEEDYTQVLDDDGKRYLKEMKQRAQNMDAMLVDLLNFVRSPQDVEPVPIEVAPFVEELLKQTVRGQAYRIFVDAPAVIYIAKTPFNVVLGNLVTNSVTHHDREEGTFRFSVHEEAYSWRMVFEDDGPGIEPRHHKRVWEMFKSAHHPKQKNSRTSGLGLTIVQQIIHDQGGTIELEAPVNSEGRGTRFIIVWPKGDQVS